MKRAQTSFKVLPAFHGDSILIKTYKSNYEELIILVDGGTSQTFRYTLKKELECLEKIDVIVLTHIDSDHIGGLIKFFESSIVENIEIKEIWINHPELISRASGSEISYKQGNSLKDLIQQKKPGSIIRNINNEMVINEYQGIEFDILSPDKSTLEKLYRNWSHYNKTETTKVNISKVYSNHEHNKTLCELSTSTFSPVKKIDDDLVNASSISFILKCPDLTLLMLADSRPEIIEECLRFKGYSEDNPLKCNYVKVSHHGSKNNTSSSLLSIIKCDSYIISTNGGAGKAKHPSRSTIARILYKTNREEDMKVKIYTNYSLDKLEDSLGSKISNEVQNSNGVIEYKKEF